jgi:hypothetical protein
VTTAAAFALIVAAARPSAAQELARFSLDSVVAVDIVRGDNAASRPNIVVDLTGVMRLGQGWLVYVRPWFRQPRAAGWDKEIYQAALQYERRAAVSTRIDLGYIVSPIGLGMMDTRPGVNPTIMPHLTYLVAMPAFDSGAPRVVPISASYPLGAQVTASTMRWDARAAVVHTAPTRSYVLNGDGNPRTAPTVVIGGGITPHIGLRLGAAVAHGVYAAAEELAVPQDEGRNVTMIAVEGEYAVRFTKVSAEFVRDRFETSAGSHAAYAWFVQGTQTLTPRLFAAARQEGASAPPRPGFAAPRRDMHVTEATVGYRIAPSFTLRGSFIARKAYTRSIWDQQAAVSLVWSQRWR